MKKKGVANLILKLIVLTIIATGEVCTLVPQVPGTLIIMSGALLYGYVTDFVTFNKWVVIWLVLLIALAEIGGRVLRVYLTSRYKTSASFSINTTAGNIAGLVAVDAILGPVIGTIIWELVAGKILMPRWDTVSKVLVRLAAVSALRFLCGLIMTYIIVSYMLK